MTIAPLFVNSCIQTYDSMERTATKDQNQRRFRKLDLTKLLHSYSLETLRNQVKEYLCQSYSFIRKHCYLRIFYTTVYEHVGIRIIILLSSI